MVRTSPSPVPNKHLVQLLAGLEAGEDDLDGPAGLVDHLARHIDDPDRLTHVEHEGLTVATDRQLPG